MKKPGYISKTMLQVALGLLIGIFVISQSVVSESHTKNKTEQNESDDDNQQHVSKQVVSHSSSLQINLDYQSYLVNEVFYQVEEDEAVPFQSKWRATGEKALKIVLRQFVSPNAP